MTDLSTPGEINAAIDNRSMAHGMLKAAGHDGYVVDGTDISEFYNSINTSGINAFEYQGASGLTVTIDGGEAFCAGWFCRDEETTVSLPWNSTVTIYAGFSVSAIVDLDSGEDSTDVANVIVGTDGAFSDDDPRLELYEFQTGNSSVIGDTDLRALDRSEAGGPYVPSGGGTFDGRVDIENSSFRNHLRLTRPGVGSWDIGPTIAGFGDGLVFVDVNNTDMRYHFQEDGDIRAGEDNDYVVQNPSRCHIYVQGSDPTSGNDVQNGDIWIET